LVAGGGVHLGVGVLGQRHLGGGDRRAAARRLGQAVVDLEVDVRPAARVRAREDGGERDDAVAAGLLHATQVGDVRQIAVLRVAAVPVAVPHVDGAGPGLRCPAGGVQQA